MRFALLILISLGCFCSSALGAECKMIVGDFPWPTLDVKLGSDKIHLKGAYDQKIASEEKGNLFDISEAVPSDRDSGPLEFEHVINGQATVTFRLTNHDDGTSIYGEWFGDAEVLIAFYSCSSNPDPDA